MTQSLSATKTGLTPHLVPERGAGAVRLLPASHPIWAPHQPLVTSCPSAVMGEARCVLSIFRRGRCAWKGVCGPGTVRPPCAKGLLTAV